MMKLESAQEIMSEAELQGTVLEILQVNGFKTHHEYDSRMAPRGRKGAKRTDKGFPDVVGIRPADVGRPQRAIAIELKAQDGFVAPEQKFWLMLLASQGFETYIFKPSDLNNGTIERIIKGG